MQALATIFAASDFEHPRLSKLEEELGIAGFQQPLWDVFVETFESLPDNLPLVDLEEACATTEAAPSLSAVLRSRCDRIDIERKGMRELIEITSLLYRSLAPQQRGRADRLLRPSASS